MHSYRVLGLVALGAIVAAVILFTAVDITIDSTNGCLAARAVCRGQGVPPQAIGCAMAGVACLVASIPSAVVWVIGMLRRPEPAEAAPERGQRPLSIDDES